VNVLFLQVFVSLCLVAGSVVLYVWTVRERTLDHADRLALAPLEDDACDRAAGADPAPRAGDPRSTSASEEIP
jgi:hypothetical protein